MNLTKEEETAIKNTSKQIVGVIYQQRKLDQSLFPLVKVILSHVDKVRAGLPSVGTGRMMFMSPQIMRDIHIFTTIAPNVIAGNKSQQFEYNELLDKMETEVKSNIEGEMSLEKMPTVYRYFNKLYEFLNMGGT